MKETVGPEGWKNYGALWPKKRGYKEIMAITEAPNGEVWTAWVPNNRKKLGSKETPSWAFLDGTDSIAVARVPQVDKTGLPKLIPLSREKFRPVKPVTYPRYQTTYNGEEYHVYFGDLHQHSEFSGCGLTNGRIDQNQHYTRYVRGLDFMCTIDHAEHLNDHNWHVIQMTAEKNYKPGKFVTFTGFEWTSEFDAGGNLFRGHYNAIFRKVRNGDYYFSASDPRYNTPLKLWDALKISGGGTQNVLTIPHHISRRLAWLSWNFYDPEMVPLIEIDCLPGAWRHAVFHITVPKSALKHLCLPEVTASISFPHGKTYKSQLFVVGSPIPISREQKAVLIDARTKIPKSQFSEYLKEMTKVWGREFQ